MAIKSNNPNIFFFLIKLPDIDLNSSKSNPLYIATQLHIIPAIRTLLEKGADPEIKFNDGINSIELAKYLRYFDILEIYENYKLQKK